jgi:hypothetical protein
VKTFYGSRICGAAAALALGVLCFAGPNASAAAAQGQEQPTEAQQTQVRAIFQKYEGDRRNPEFRKEIMAVLTPEQRAKLKEMREKQREGRGGRPQAGDDTP